jgi:hypothetical protein
VNLAGPPLPAAARTALWLGLLVSFAAGVDAVRWIGPALLTDADPSWAASRLLLWLLVLVLAALAGGAAAGAFVLWSRIPAAGAPLRPLALPAWALGALVAAAIVAGAALRFAALDREPEAMWVDDVSLIRPALALRGAPPDFANAIRSAPFGVPRPYGTVGVLYLEGYRAVLRLWGTTVFGVRFPSALAGVASLVTATLLGRALLPSGGGALAALILAGLRWHLILSRWAWVMLALAPIVDVATLLAIRAREPGRRGPAWALGAGLVAGIGAHVYLSAWPAGAALAFFLLLPSGDSARSRPPRVDAARSGLLRAAAFGAGFAICAAPLFLFREGRVAPYFARTADHNVFLEMARQKSSMPPVAAAADTLAAPWFLSDPTPRHDLPGRRRLPWPLGVAVAIAFARAFLRPRDAVSGLLLAHGAVVLLAVVAGGQADHPNGSRFAYLASLAAVAAAAGVLWLVGLLPAARRRAAALAAVGMVAVLGVLGARDALIVWPERPETFASFHGQDTWIGRAASRWDAYGPLAIEPGIAHSALAFEAIRGYRLDPDVLARGRGGGRPLLRSRLVHPGTAPDSDERVVERVVDPWGKEWARVLSRREPRG